MATTQENRSELAAAMLLEKIVRDTYSAKSSKEIQPLQWSILRYLDRNPAQRCTMSWVKSFLGLTHAPVVRAINTLVSRELVRQEPNPNDARSNLLFLTEQGKRALELDPIAKVANRMRELPEEERKTLMRSIRSLALSTASAKEGT